MGLGLQPFGWPNISEPRYVFLSLVTPINEKLICIKVYATVGNPEKVDLLVEKHGIQRDHIFSSRDISAVEKIMQATNGRGIDVILSSSGGDMMHETFRCLAPLGRFVDVGRTDAMGHGKLAMEVFRRNATFSSFDLGILGSQRPDVLGQ